MQYSAAVAAEYWKVLKETGVWVQTKLIFVVSVKNELWKCLILNTISPNVIFNLQCAIKNWLLFEMFVWSKEQETKFRFPQIMLNPVHFSEDHSYILINFHSKDLKVQLKVSSKFQLFLNLLKINSFPNTIYNCCNAT